MWLNAQLVAQQAQVQGVLAQLQSSDKSALSEAEWAA